MVNHSKIEWLTDTRTGVKGYSVNPIKGICQHQCPYCYAKRLYKRFKWNPEVRFDKSAFEGLEKLKPGSKIFVGSTHDIFGNWIPDEWINSIILRANQYPQLIFIFLTKNPKRYSEFAFPKNVWIGYSTTGPLYHEWDSKHKNNVKFISIEPMMGELVNTSYLHDTNLIIVGRETGNRKGQIVPKIEWINDVINISKDNGIKLFLKNNLNYKPKTQNLPI